MDRGRCPLASGQAAPGCHVLARPLLGSGLAQGLLMTERHGSANVERRFPAQDHGRLFKRALFCLIVQQNFAAHRQPTNAKGARVQSVGASTVRSDPTVGDACVRAARSETFGGAG
jgi:hypothetical protein